MIRAEMDNPPKTFFFGTSGIEKMHAAVGVMRGDRFVAIAAHAGAIQSESTSRARDVRESAHVKN
jgi:hypothetical protein